MEISDKPKMNMNSSIVSLKSVSMYYYCYYYYYYYYYYSFNVRHLRAYAGQTFSPRCHISMHRANKSRSD